MTKNTIGVCSNKTIISLYNMMKSGELVLHPDFQRKLVWNDAHKENFLETIILGYPFPEIYIANGEVDYDSLQQSVYVVDGQQRLNTIYQYISSDPELVLKRIKPYKELEDKNSFLEYDVVVRDLKSTPMERIKEIFKRINSVSYALNAMEINNALYDGEFIKTAKRITETDKLKNMDLFDDTSLNRMKDLEFVLLIMSTYELRDYFAGDRLVEDFIKRYDNDYPNSKETFDVIVSTLDYINELKLAFDSVWRSRNAMFTLVCELMFYYSENNKLPDNEKAKVSLDLIEKEIKRDNPKEEYESFYMALFQSTRSKKSRNIRGKLLRKKLKEC